MNKSGIQIEIPISIDKILLFSIYFSIAFYEKNFLNIT